MRTHVLTLMSLALAVLLALGWLVFSGAPVSADDSVTFNGATLASSIWDDGKAEVTTYSVERPFYGDVRQGEATFIVVKEPWDTKKHVKSDTSSPVDVLKLHRVEEVVTPYYPYRFATTSFVPRVRPGHTLKLASTSQEWCGTTYQAWRDAPDGGEYEWRSYFGAEADGMATIEVDAGLPVLMVDSLPLTMRSLELDEGELGRAQLVSSLISNHALPPQVNVVTLTASRDESIHRDTEWRIEARTEDGAALATIWVDAGAPHVMTRAALPGGITYRLEGTERRAYWPGGDPPPGDQR